MPKFIPGLQLSNLFYQKEIKPILDKEFSSLRYSAAVIGWGSEVLGFDTPISREKWLSKAYSVMAQQHNALRITKPLPVKVSDYYRRPYSVIYGDRFAAAIIRIIKDPQVKRIKREIGSVDQFTDSANVIQDLALCKSLSVVYK